MLVKLIINADDFGNDENRTNAILEAFKMGFVSQTTVMMNMPGARTAMERAKSAGVMDRVGLHLNLTEGLPLTIGISKCPLFCNEDGQFNRAFKKGLSHRLWLDEGVLRLVREEVAAQMETFFSYKPRLFHFDSHHNVHTDWSMAKDIAHLAADFGFRTVRPAWRRCDAYLWFVYRRFGHAGRFLAGHNVFDGLNKMHEEVVEWMVHPRYARDGRLSDGGVLCNGNHTPMGSEFPVGFGRRDVEVVTY